MPMFKKLIPLCSFAISNHHRMQIFLPSRFRCEHHLVHRFPSSASKSLTAILPTTTAFTTPRDHFSRQAADTRKKAPFTTHTISRRRSQICGRREIPEKNFSKKLARRVAKWSIFGCTTAHSRRTWNIDDCFRS